ncbi:hypothetical protein J7E96_06315 [Streptomyces sp. ISL-96]|uniref:hypothetical protein n=1 Tax=Streptomyces sp. ISL-96 TaxID=2819191 RepID=UPI001BECEA56|nr:hypothetical protein [Streptomyces sp. ISL-96]MBT2488145.1 hypothetical protein [Streptomyces sp. ISL-96]
MPGPSTTPATPAAAPVGDTVGEVVRWAAFSCALVPVVLVVYGMSFGGAAAAALGLTAVTAVCRVLLRRSERAAAEAAGEIAAVRKREQAKVPGARRGGRHAGRSAPGE